MNTIILLTPNQRLSHYLYENRNKFAIKKLNNIAIKIFPLEKWLNDIFELTQSNLIKEKKKVFLTQTKEILLWESIIERHSAAKYIYDVTATAQLASDTWSLMHAWKLSKELIQKHQTHDAQQFLEWANEFNNVCEAKGFVTQSELINEVIFSVDLIREKLPDEILLVNFQELTPQQNKLVERLSECVKAGKVTSHELFGNVDAVTKPVLYKVPDEKDEVKAMANWIRNEVEKDNNKEIGCIIPNLHSIRNKIVMALHDAGVEKFNVSGGDALSQYSMIYAGLGLLKLLMFRIRIDDISYMLGSPYLSEEEKCQRAALDVQLHEYNSQRVPLSYVIKLASKEDSAWYCPGLAAQLSELNKLKSELVSRALPSEWCNIFKSVLDLMQWPGEKSKDSKLKERWDELLNEFSDYDTVVNKLGLSEALIKLRWLANNSVYQPASEDCNVQVLGMLEAAGMQFDKVWIMGMDAQSWPSKARPNALIPMVLQREVGLPHATAQREWEYSKKLMDGWVHDNGELVFSYAESVGVSALLTHYHGIDTGLDNESMDSSARWNEVSVHSEFTEKNEEYGPAVSAEENIRGGSAIFKLQAACPFKAFAELRLGAYAINETKNGIDERARGILVHTALELLWQNIQNASALHDYLHNYVDDLKTLIAGVIDKACERLNREFTPGFPDYLMELEKKRLAPLLMKWLQVESKRPDFEVVACEQWQKVNVEGIEVSIKIDRIDRVGDDKHLMIDYKTGQCSIHDWFDDYPAEPQLPLYATHANVGLNGMLFAQVNSKYVGFKGVTEDDAGIKYVVKLSDAKVAKASDDWQQQLTAWKVSLNELMQQFKDGYAKVDPADPEVTCAYCDLHSLCRVEDVV